MSADTTLETGASPPAIPDAPETFVSEEETLALASEPPAPAAAPADISPADEAGVESAEQVPAEAASLPTPVSLPTPNAPPAERAAKPPPPPAVALPQPMSARPSIPPWELAASKRTTALRMGVAVLLLGFGFILGRVTAPTPTDEQAMPAKAASLEATVKAVPMPHPAPIDTTVPVATAAAAPSSVPNEPVATPQAPTSAPIAPPAATARISAPDAPPHAVTTVRAVSTARSERIEPSEVIPASSPDPTNPLVQAVQDDIKEDEASHKKSAQRPR